MADIIISFKNLNVVFPYKGKDIKAVENTSLNIYRGEVFGIVGTSGAGKSTLLRTINLLQRPTQGEVFVNGENISGLKGNALRKLRTGIGMIFQQFSLINTKTVYDNVAFAMEAVGKSKMEIQQRVPEVLELVGLSDRAKSYPAKLSGGEKQRVGIARALANNPYILLCDEPTSALDLENTNAILKLLKEINENLGITIVIISHEMDVIKKICNRVAVMSGGKIIETNEVFNVFTAPQEPFTQSLVNHTLNFELPERIRQNTDLKLLKIVYSGEKAEEAVISDTIKNLEVEINILHGKIEYITNKPFGVLIVQITGNPEKVKEAQNYLTTRVYKVEEL
ncbi:methionine import ATP-binding protein MetN 2 [Bacteroidia bacterium]|nr:methionine import ATP-binding protein MetN 2 [Bacteroidia bacterium]